MAYDPGDVWTPNLTVKNAAGVLTAATVSLSVTSPSGVITTPSVTTASTGLYASSVPLTEVGRWVGTWTVSGAVVGVEVQSAYVRELGSNVIAVADVRSRLHMTLTASDAVIDDMIDAACAEYVEWVGPLTGSVTEVFDGGQSTIALNSAKVLALTAVSYDSGDSLSLTDLTVQNGVVRWKWNTAGRFLPGRRVTITYTVLTVPANHREKIIADVAGYFAVTQRSIAGPAVPGNTVYTEGYQGHPLDLFPRIRALAESYCVIG